MVEPLFHSGSNRHAREPVPPEGQADLEDLAQYILRNPFSVEKMTLESPTDLVIYRSRLNAKINRNFEVFRPTDFLAAITQHIPDKGAQMVRYYGWYSNKMRGVRQSRLAGLKAGSCRAPASSGPVCPESRYVSRFAWPLGRCRPPALSAMGQDHQKLAYHCLLTPSARSGRMGPQ